MTSDQFLHIGSSQGGTRWNYLQGFPPYDLAKSEALNHVVYQWSGGACTGACDGALEPHALKPLEHGADMHLSLGLVVGASGSN
jgi:hypothetical protein